MCACFGVGVGGRKFEAEVETEGSLRNTNASVHRTPTRRITYTPTYALRILATLDLFEQQKQLLLQEKIRPRHGVFVSSHYCIIALQLTPHSLPLYLTRPPPPPERKEREKKNKRAGRMYVSGASCVYCPPPSPSSPKAARAARKQDSVRARAASPPLPFELFW